LDNVRLRVLNDTSQPALVSGSQRITVIAAVPGLGKSTLATAFARLVEVRRAFPDGIVWLDYRWPNG
jgi:ABC-type proline/glycine betaine transport system ATPase subunit